MSQNPYLTLIRCITALYLTNKTPGSWEEVHRTIGDTLKTLEIPTVTIGEADYGMVAINLKTTAEWMLKAHKDVEFDRADLLMRVRMNLKEISSYAVELENALPIEITENDTRRRVQSIYSELRYELNLSGVRKLISKANQKINFSHNSLDHFETLRELQDNLTTYTRDSNGDEHSGFVGRLSSDDVDGLAEVFNKAKEINSTEGVLRTGWVGLNRACGVGGFRRGELINFGALTHHYKTGMLNDLTRQIPLYNDPWMWDAKKKPAVLRISFENKLEQDLPIIYRSLIEQETGEKIDIAEVDPIKAGQYVRERLQSRGYYFFMECYDPNNFTVHDLLNILIGYEAKGYEIHLAVIDYLELIANGTERKDEIINNVFQVTRNHCFPRGITVATGHQLSTEAQAIWREGALNFTARVSNGGYYRNTKSLATKLDLEFVQCLISSGEDKYISIARGKHRGGEHTPVKHQNFAYKFERVGGLVDDIEAEVPRVIYNLNQVIAGSVDYDEGESQGDDDVW